MFLLRPSLFVYVRQIRDGLDDEHREVGAELGLELDKKLVSLRATLGSCS
jgi:hypothetical protein